MQVTSFFAILYTNKVNDQREVELKIWLFSWKRNKSVELRNFNKSFKLSILFFYLFCFENSNFVKRVVRMGWILSSNLNCSSNFTSIIVVWIFFLLIFVFFCSRGNTKCNSWRKNSILGKMRYKWTYSVYLSIWAKKYIEIIIKLLNLM